MELHKANLEAQNQAIAVASSHHILPTASCSSTTNAGLLPAATALFPQPQLKPLNPAMAAASPPAAVTTNTVNNGGLMSTGTGATPNFIPCYNELLAVQNPFAAAAAAAAAAASAYHVTPKLKSPSGLIAVSSGRGTDKFAPY